MSDQDSAQDVISKYQRKQQRAPRAFIIGVIALLLIFIGGVLLYQWYQNPDTDLLALISQTETPTNPPSPSETAVPPTATSIPPTDIPPPTDTPTITPTPTISGPFIYTVQEGDTLSSISEQFGIELVRLMDVNELGNDPIFIGQQLLIPDPNEAPPTKTPLPDNLPRGTIIEYRIQPNDSLTAIAIAFNSTLEAILEANEDLENENEIFVGQIVLIPVNLVTPAPTGTDAPVSTPGAIATLTSTPEPTNTP